MTDFLFHSVSEEEKEQIRKEAKKMLDSFSDKISKVKVSDEEPNVRRKDFEREEKDGVEGDHYFRSLMFETAPNKSSEFILAEKKKWD